MRFKACARCHGDLRKDGDEWVCFQCGARYYPKPPENTTYPVRGDYRGKGHVGAKAGGVRLWP